MIEGAQKTSINFPNEQELILGPKVGDLGRGGSFLWQQIKRPIVGAQNGISERLTSIPNPSQPLGWVVAPPLQKPAGGRRDPNLGWGQAGKERALLAYASSFPGQSIGRWLS